jgi:hypothetical protein
LWTALAHAQRPSASVKQFAGCYEVTSLSWNPPDNRIKLIPPRFELSMQIFDDAYHVQPAPRNAPATAYMRLFSWKPAGHAVKISFNGGLGGWRGSSGNPVAVNWLGTSKSGATTAVDGRNALAAFI